MRDELEKLFKNRDRLLNNLKNARHDILAEMYEAFLDKKSFYSKIKKLSFNRDMVAVNNIIDVSQRMFNRYEKRKPNVEPPIFFAMLMDREHLNEKLRFIENQDVTEKFSERKQDIINADLKNNFEHNKIFYLCSAHGDSALDHVNYQGRIYVDDNYDNSDKNINKFIRDNNIKSYQWVMGEPVYMVTRPNCRHYFKALKTSDVLNKSTKTLIKENDMYRKIGERNETQTLPPRKRLELGYIKSYEDRLELHKKMYAKNPNEYLKNAIEKDLMLIRKWKNKK